MAIDYRFCSVDIETLGTRPGDVILSIGAVLFNPTTGEFLSEIELTIDQKSSREAGLRAQKSTLEWWSQQSTDAQAAAFKGQYSLEEALTRFTAWLPREPLMYGNGASFDNALIQAAYRAIKKDVPWPYWNDRCYRTLSNMFLTQRVERFGVAHRALDDAKTQALRLTWMVNHHKLTLK